MSYQPTNLNYVLLGICADIAQLGMAHSRGEKDGVKKNIEQIIEKLEKAKTMID